jgi:hypothetical protein
MARKRSASRSPRNAPRISDRDRAFRNILARDVLIAERIEQQACTRGLTVLRVDAESLENNVERVATRVERWLEGVR